MKLYRERGSLGTEKVGGNILRIGEQMVAEI